MPGKHFLQMGDGVTSLQRNFHSLGKHREPGYDADNVLQLCPPGFVCVIHQALAIQEEQVEKHELEMTVPII